MKVFRCEGLQSSELINFIVEGLIEVPNGVSLVDLPLVGHAQATFFCLNPVP